MTVTDTRGATGATPGPRVVHLRDLAGHEHADAGRKATALARAAAAGLPVLPGVVLTTGPGEGVPPALASAVRGLPAPWIVRSSSPHEDGENSSRAGHFRTVRDVRGPAELERAVAEVVASADGGPMAVLVQPQRSFALAGVLFGADPVTGRPGMTVAATSADPDALVSGQVDGDLLSLDGRGRLRRDGHRVRTVQGVPAAALGRALARLARSAAEVFGGPQDIEWGWTADGDAVLLQSRPITRSAAPVPDDAPLLGAGPLAETFPRPLWPLEADLWLPPMRQGLENALRRTGARVPGNGEPLVRSVGGHAVAVLEALGAAPGRRRAVDVLDPRPGLRRLRASWRVGRLRAGLGEEASGLIRDTDALLAAVPPAPDLTEPQLMGVLTRAADALAVLHEYEALAGLVVSGPPPSVTAAGTALRVLAASGRPAAELVRDEPVLLALVPPSIGPAAWPRTPVAPPPAGPGKDAGSAKDTGPGNDGGSAKDTGPARDGRPGTPAPPARPAGAPDAALLREALRLRARWVQELQAAAARELGLRLVESGRLGSAYEVRELHLDELLRLLRDPERERRAAPAPEPGPLPEVFRLAEDGSVVAWEPPARRRRRRAPGEELRGRGASPGRHEGVVVHDPAGLAEHPPGTAVLVVPALGPELAVHLPYVGALVARTGSPLSHLAILAREHGVPAVVSLPGALEALPDGSRVLVDGRAGTVTPRQENVITEVAA